MTTTMRWVRFTLAGEDHFGALEGATVKLLDRAPWKGGAPTGRTVPFEGLALLSPSDASKVVCVGQNYLKHAQEMGKPVPQEPLLFIKPSTALNPHRAAIRIPPASEEVHYEAELGLVIGERLTRVDEASAARGIWGLTCINDVTARDIQRRETQHTRAKSYDTFACVGPWAVTGLAPGDLRILARVNGQIRQDSRTSDMIFNPARLVSFISHVMTLLPGDLISTGTPSGVGKLEPGDVVEVELEGIGVLVNPVVKGA